MRIGYLGPEGSFTHETAEHAARQHGWDDARFLSFRTGPEAVAAVARGEVDLAVVPVATSRRGRLAAENATIEMNGVRRLGELQRVSHYFLLGMPGAHIEGLTTVLSDPEAFFDCERRLSALAPGVVRLTVTSTGAAAARVAREGRRDWAAIAPEDAARRYGLGVLAGNLEDDPTSQTTWAILGPKTQDV